MRGSGTESSDRAARQSPAARCPSPGDLSDFSRGALPLAALHSIAQHVSVCAACDSKVSTFVSDLAQRPTIGDHAPSEAPVESAADNAALDLRDAHIDAIDGEPDDKPTEAPTTPLRLGQYRLVRQIGRGGMGVVYQARHERLLRDVAIKFVAVETIQDLLDVERLEREMAAAGTLRHPNVVYATDAGESEGVHYLVMEYVDGVDLSKLVSRVGPLPVADACEIIRQAAEGLAHVEQQQLVHRDLKPSNLMLSADGTVKILDLGLARARVDDAEARELTRDGYLLGTIDYVAPEQARDARAADIRSDIYSLGCTFYKLLTGAPPFGGAGQQSVASKILAHEQKPPPPLADFRSDVPSDVEQIVRRMLAKDPANRFQSPVELRRSLKVHVAGADLPALLARARIAPPSSPPRQKTWGESKPSTIVESADGKHSTIAGPRPARLSTTAKVALGSIVCLAVLLGLAWAGGWLPALSGSAPRGTRQPSPTVDDILAASNSGQIDYPFPEGHPGISGQVTSPVPGVLQLESELIQLVKLGYLRDDAQRISFSIDQPSWRGQIGVFLGYHVDRYIATDKGGKTYDGEIAEFQLLLLNRVVGAEPRDHYIEARRMLARVFPRKKGDIPDLYYDAPAVAASRIPLPKPGQAIPFLIEFSGRGLNRQIAHIRINGVNLDDLADPEFHKDRARDNVRFTPRDYEGAIGLFNFGNIGGATFSNFDLSNLEKE